MNFLLTYEAETVSEAILYANRLDSSFRSREKGFERGNWDLNFKKVFLESFSHQSKC